MSNNKNTVPAGTPNDGLPLSWQAIVEPRIAAPQAPPAAFSSASPQLAASIPLNAQLVPDMMPTRYPGGMGGYRIFPPIPAANPGINAAVQSIVDNTPCCAPVPIPVEIGGELTICGDYTAGAANIGELLSFQCNEPFPIPGAQGDFCYNGALPLIVSFTVPPSGLQIGDKIVINISVYNLGNPMGDFTDNHGNTSTFMFNQIVSGAVNYTNSAAYITLTSPVSPGSTYSVTASGLAPSTTGEITIQAWRNLGTPQLGEIVFVSGVSPYSTLNPSITTTDARVLLIFEGTLIDGTIPANWIVATKKIATFWPAPQLYWNNGSTALATAGTYAPAFTSGTGGYGVGIVPFV